MAWHAWLCGPPILGDDDEEIFPAAAAVPMGFCPSAGSAQALADVVTAEACLPDDRRAHPEPWFLWIF